MLFDETTHEPGQRLDIIGRRLLLSRPLCVLDPGVAVPAGWEDAVVVRPPRPCRLITVVRCHIVCYRDRP